jgi:hypothetical protein
LICLTGDAIGCIESISIALSFEYQDGEGLAGPEWTLAMLTDEDEGE